MYSHGPSAEVTDAARVSDTRTSNLLPSDSEASTTEHLTATAAERLYKHALRKERAAWDALFAKAPSSQEFRVWRRMTVEANEARIAFLQPDIVSDAMNGLSQPQSHASLKQLLKDAIQRQKDAWTALEQSVRSDGVEDPRLRAAWVDALGRVRAARKRLHAQTLGTSARTQ